MFDFALVDVKSITSNIPRSNFADAELENLADMILESGGIIRPLVLKVTGEESYTVVEGDREYYAAARAQEKNARQGEMVNAFVISPKNEETILKQATALRGAETIDRPVKPLPDTTNVESRIANLELRLEKQFNELRTEQIQEKQKIEAKFKEFDTQSKESSPLEVFNTLSSPALVLRLRSAGFTDKLAVQLAESVAKERDKREFDSLKDVIARVKVKYGKRDQGISSDKMVAIIDTWSQISFS